MRKKVDDLVKAIRAHRAQQVKHMRIVTERPPVVFGMTQACPTLDQIDNRWRGQL